MDSQVARESHVLCVSFPMEFHLFSIAILDYRGLVI